MDRPTLLISILVIFAFTAPVFGQTTDTATSECGIKKPNCEPGDMYLPFKLTAPVTVSPEPDHHLIPARGGKLDLGLALSGGGLRSGIFTIGVLKALFDKELLEKVDVISSVSGGSYANFWLWTNFERGNGSLFGERAFNNQIWFRNTCELQSLGNMMTKSKLVKAVLARSDNAAASYEWGILRTFGNGLDCKQKIASIAEKVLSGDVPYPIFNTSVVSKKLDVDEKIFEITPFHMGNDKFGYFKWAENGNNSMRLTQVVQTSGAGNAKLSQKIPNYSSGNTTDPEVKTLGPEISLEDGGRTENLAIYSLVKRRIPTIIAIDAAHDYKYEFENYEDLKSLLKEKGYKLTIEKIDKFPKDGKVKNGYMPDEIDHGFIKKVNNTDNRETPIKIYFIKLSRPKGILLERKVECDRVNNFGKAFREGMSKEDYERYERGREKVAELTKKTKTACDGQFFHCAPAENEPFDADIYYYRARRYSRKINCGFDYWKLGFKLTDDFDFRFRFPQMSTADLSYKRDQLEALLGLGYLHGEMLDAALIK